MQLKTSEQTLYENCFEGVLACTALNLNRRYEWMYRNEWKFRLEMLSEGTDYPLGQALELYRNKVEPLTEFHSICYCQYPCKCLGVLQNILKLKLDEGMPIAVRADAYFCPWNKNYGKYHNPNYIFLSNGLETERVCFICSDPFYQEWNRPVSEDKFVMMYVEQSGTFIVTEDASSLTDGVKIFQETLKSLFEEIAAGWRQIKNLTLKLLLSRNRILQIAFITMNSKMTQYFAKRQRQEIGMITGKLFEILTGMRGIRLLCAEWWSRKTLFSRQHDLFLLKNDIRKLDFAVNKRVYHINVFTTLIIYGINIYLIFSGAMTIGMFLAVIKYVVLLHKKFNWMLRIYLDWFTRKASIDRVSEILETGSESDVGQSFFEPIREIQFRDVSFSYESGIPVLRNISFSIRAGKRVAIGVVQQDIFLFKDTVRYNLLLGNCYCDDEELIAVCQSVGLKSWLSGLPPGVRYPLGAQGLLGGQKQRLMIAQILLNNVGTVVFDEPTSALDRETECLVMEEFVKQNRDMTIIVISHRVEAVKMCDRVIMLKEGQVVEVMGKHEKLLNES